MNLRSKREQLVAGATHTVFVPRSFLAFMKGVRGEYRPKDSGLAVTYSLCGSSGSDAQSSMAVGLDSLRCLCLLLSLPENLDSAALPTRAKFARAFRRGPPDTQTKTRIDRLLKDLALVYFNTAVPEIPFASGSDGYPVLETTGGERKDQVALSKRAHRLGVQVGHAFRTYVAMLSSDAPNELVAIHIPSFLTLTSDFAAWCYLELVAVALAHPEERPAQVPISRLWAAVGLPIPQYVSVQKKLLTQNRRSVIRQLNGCMTGFAGARLRVRLTTEESTDAQLIVWSQLPDQSHKR